MPRDASGIYTLPAGNPVVTGTIISSEWCNPTMADIAVALNNVVTRDGLLGFTQPALFPDGTVGAPGIAFANAPNTGIFRSPSGGVGISYGGAQAAFISTINTAFNSDTGVWVMGTAGHDSRLGLNKPASGLNSYISGSTNGVARWAILMGDTSPETGGNAGSNFQIYRYPDTGTPAIGSAFSINRASGNVYIGNEAEDNALSFLNMSLPIGPWKEAKLRSTTGGAQYVVDSLLGAASGCGYIFRKNGSTRWAIACQNDAEAGGNTGSTFIVARAGDNGLQIDTPVRIDRATGNITLGSHVFPAADAAYSLGGPGKRWANIYLTNGIISGPVVAQEAFDALEARVAALEARP